MCFPSDILCSGVRHVGYAHRLARVNCVYFIYFYLLMLYSTSAEGL